MTAIVIICFASAAADHGGASTLTLAAAIGFTVMLAMTLALNMPINLAVFGLELRSTAIPHAGGQLRRR